MHRRASQFAYHAFFTVEVLFCGRSRVDTLRATRSVPVRFGQLARIVPDSSKKNITKTFRDLEAAGVVMRKDPSDVVFLSQRNLEVL